MDWLFKLRGKIPKGNRLVLELLGVGLILLVWYFLSYGDDPIVSKLKLPSPASVFLSYGEMFRDNSLIQNTFHSIGLNLGGYIKAILWTVPIGFAIGLTPLLRGMFHRIIDGVRFVPLAACIFLFTAFGTGITMKINFLAFGIFIFLLPIVIQRIDQVKDVYLKTVYTIGANNWQTIKSVYIPSVMSKLIDDIRILTAISWTYIVVAETTAEDGGLGALIQLVRRRVQTDKLFAILILFILIGVFQDKIFSRLDRELFPHKYQVKDAHKHGQLEKVSMWDTIFDFAFKAFVWSSLGIYLVLALNEFMGFLGGIKVLDYLFGDSCWAFHVVMISVIVYKIRKWFIGRPTQPKLVTTSESDVSG